MVKHRIIGVANYDKSFPDSQYVQLESSKKYAVKAVLNRQDAELRKKELVYIGSNPFFVVKRCRVASISCAKSFYFAPDYRTKLFR